MIIRAYSEQDREPVMTLLKLNTPAFFAPEEEQDLSDYLYTDAENYFVLQTEEGITASGGFNLLDNGRTARISWDMVHPGGQGKGWGSALVRFRLQQLKAVSSVETIVVRTSQLVYPFYERFGFRTKEMVKDYWAKGFDLYYMELEPSVTGL